MTMNRRSFLRGLLVATGTAMVVSPVDLLAGPALPRIVGDGIHDDTVGLQAALDGKPFEADGLVVRSADRVHINGGVYRITNTLTIPPTTKSIIQDAELDAQALSGGKPALHYKGNGHGNTLSNIIIRGVSSANMAVFACGA